MKGEHTTSRKPRILVIGISGEVGAAAARNRLAHGDTEVRVAPRKPASLQALAAAGALDLDGRASIERAVRGADRLLLLTGYTVDMLKQSKRVLDAATAAGGIPAYLACIRDQDARPATGPASYNASRVRKRHSEHHRPLTARQTPGCAQPSPVESPPPRAAWARGGEAAVCPARWPRARCAKR